MIVRHENHPLALEATLLENLGPISWLLTALRGLSGILFGFAGRIIYYLCDIFHRQLPLLLNIEVRCAQTPSVPLLHPRTVCAGGGRVWCKRSVVPLCVTCSAAGWGNQGISAGQCMARLIPCTG